MQVRKRGDKFAVMEENGALAVYRKVAEFETEAEAEACARGETEPAAKPKRTTKRKS